MDNYVICHMGKTNHMDVEPREASSCTKFMPAELPDAGGHGGLECESSERTTGRRSEDDIGETTLIVNQLPFSIVPPTFRDDDEGADYLLERIRHACELGEMYPAVEDGWVRRDWLKCFSGLGKKTQKRFIRKLNEDRHSIELQNFMQVQWLRPTAALAEDGAGSQGCSSRGPEPGRASAQVAELSGMRDDCSLVDPFLRHPAPKATVPAADCCSCCRLL